MELINNSSNSNKGSNALQKSQRELPSIQRTLSLCPTYNDFTAKFNPDKWEASSRQPTKCVVCNSPTLTDINLAYGDGRSIAWLMAQLTVFQEKLNVPHKMSVYEIETCAQTIYDYFHHLKATEIMLFLARLLGGMYPVDWHGYVTPTKIVSALRENFMPWRNDLYYKIEQQEKQKHKEELAKQNFVTYEEWVAMERSQGREPNNATNPLLNLK